MKGDTAGLVGVVMIARNEARTIGTCLEAAVRAVHELGGGPVLLVDSASTDGTAGHGMQCGVQVIRVRRASRICPSAMRRIGADHMNTRYIMFLDGDCEVVEGFLRAAVRRMEERPDLGVVAGTRRDYYRTPAGVVPATQDYYANRQVLSPGQAAYGGCALYRAEALNRAGSFNPFLRAREEEDLSYRLEDAGFNSEVMDIPMIRHMTVPRESSERLLRSFRHGFMTGGGQAVRLFLSRGLFRAAVRGLDRPILALAHLFCGAAATLAWIDGVTWPIQAWLTITVLGLLAFLVRTRSPRRVLYYVTEWTAWAGFLVVGFFLPRPDPSTFRWEGEIYRPDDQASQSLPRVLLVGPCPPPPLRGGVEKGVALLMSSPLASRTSMRVFNNFRPHDPKRRAWERLRYQWGKLSAFRAELRSHPVDLVHVKTSSGINFHQNVLYAQIARRAGFPILLQLHCGKFEAFYAGSGLLTRAWIRWHLAKATQVVALSQSWKSRILRIAPSATVTVVPNGLAESELAVLADSRERNESQILFLGTGQKELDREKGIEDLLVVIPKVMQRHPQAQWVLAGLGTPDEVRESLHRSLHLLAQAGSSVRCTGIVTDEERVNLFKQSSILVLPSYFENMPNVLLEAMAAGMGVVAADVGAVREMLRDGKGGVLVAPGDHVGLEQALTRLLALKALVIEQGSVNRRIVQSEYTMSVVQQRLEDLYRELAHWPNPASSDSSRRSLAARSDLAISPNVTPSLQTRP